MNWTPGPARCRSDEYEAAAIAIQQDIKRQFDGQPTHGSQYDPIRWTATGGVIDCVELARAAIAAYRDAEIADLRAKLEAAEQRLYWLAITDMGIDQIGEIDLHEAAYVIAVNSGREEPNDSDMLAALSYTIDAARGG